MFRNLVSQGNRLEFQRAEVVGEDFSGRRVDRFSAVSSRFIDCSFGNVVIKQACFGEGQAQSEYENCSFRNSDITASAPGNVVFSNCKFTYVRIREFIGIEAEFVGCQFSGTLSRCVFQGEIPEFERASAKRDRNRFTANDFSGAEFDDVSFRAGIDLKDQVLPRESAYKLISDGAHFISVVRKRFLEERDLELRESVFKVLRVLQFDIDEGQKQLYVSGADFPPSLRPTAERLFLEFG